MSPWHPPKLPLGAYVRPRPEYDEEVLLPGHGEEGREVEELREVPPAAAKVEDAPLRVVQVPGHVDVDGVEAGGAVLPQPVPPLPRVDAEVVQGAAEQGQVQTVEGEGGALVGAEALGDAALREVVVQGREVWNN